MKPTKTTLAALKLLKKRVRYENTGLHLPGSSFNAPDDTKAIQAATRIYVETWIIPIIEAMESGDARLINESL